MGSTRTRPLTFFTWKKLCSPVACAQTSPLPQKNREKRLFSRFFLREGGRLYTGLALIFVPRASVVSASFFQVKMFTGSVRVLLTGVSLRLIEFRQIYCCWPQPLNLLFSYCTCIVPGNWLQPINLFFSLSILTILLAKKRDAGAKLLSCQSI